ncbi:carboxylesterase family protein [Pedobacter jamesrossensis]|uniref:Dienelactone hydrolase family protein n=1 Tax=Pedobacter jamesrossensis TaxID=1908238 RepID=A0ABV8NQ99_9SPHI
MQNKFFYLFTLILLNTSIAIAQIRTSDNLKVDSLTFINARATLNKISNDNFEKRIYKQDNQELPYRLLLPKNYDKSKKYPLVITFHNSSRIGNDNEKQLEPLSKIWLRDEIFENYNCLVIAPQFNERSSNYSENENGILVSKPSNKINLVLDLLNALEQEYSNIDKSRIYLIGYSMGASTAQNLSSIAPKKFAAMVSIAAVPDFSNLKAMKNKNIFLIHGEKDVENPYKGSVELFEKLRNSKKITFKTYTELNHDNINIPLLLNDEIPKWLFRQKK